MLLFPTCHFTKSATAVSRAVFTCLTPAESAFKLNGTVPKDNDDLSKIPSEFSVVKKKT